MDFNIGVSEIRQLTLAIRSQYGFDFSNYALSSFRRRVSRFVQFQNIGSVSNLISRLKADRTFFDFFLKEITVNVTEMFRDPSFWREFRDQALPELAKRPRIRIWHAGCASGEEVYTMAIVLQEAGLLSKSRILATDINEDVLENAKLGLYSAKKMELNTRNYTSFKGAATISSYCNTIGDRVQMDPALLKHTDFKVHDLVRDQSFDQFHLVMCRNVLIYFNRELQNHVMKTFDDSLPKGGYLALGTMESLEGSAAKPRFSNERFDEKIYKKVGS